MKAVGYQNSLPLTDPASLLDIEMEQPTLRDRDLLIEVKAVSVNPVDTKVRRSANPDEGQKYKVLGYDCAGIVRQVGKMVSLFKRGDEVYYAGSIARPGTNAEYHAVDERIVGTKPRTLSFADAAAMPLTAITAWELLFDRFHVESNKSSQLKDRRSTLLIIGGAGGVGSMMIQLANRLTSLTVVATASRPETVAWCQRLGAHRVVDHTHSIADELRNIGIHTVEYIASLTATDKHYPGIVDLLAPQGKFGVIDDPPVLDAKPLKRKSASLHWEYMFARPVYETADILRQHDLLTEVARLTDLGSLRTTATQNLGTINAENLKKAHEIVESGKSIGKIVLEGW